MKKSIYYPALKRDIIVSRRKGTKHLKIAITSDGEIKLSIPYGVSERQAVKFLGSKLEWLQARLPATHSSHVLSHGDRIGKHHTIVITHDSSIANPVTTRLYTTELRIKLRGDVLLEDPSVQAKIIASAEKALRSEADRLLPQRLDDVAHRYGLGYKSVTTKKLNSRWGSCDQSNNIMLNIFLMQLPWELIDYVLLHELVHTVHKHHQAPFWDMLEDLMPVAKQRRKDLKHYTTRVTPT